MIVCDFNKIKERKTNIIPPVSVAMQIVSTKNIRKITSSMKMVSAAKLKGDETRLKTSKPFSAWTSAMMPAPQEMDEATFDDLPQKCLLVPFTSDRGLCGGINSFISRGVRNCINAEASQGKDFDVVIVGEKGRAQIRRICGENVVRSATDIVSPGTFALASGLASEVMTAVSEKEYDAIVLMYNSYVNPAVYKQMYQVIRQVPEEGEEGEALSEYEFDGNKNEVMADMYEYMMATQVFYTFMDAAAAEQSSRMAAMENATKNAGEMIDALTLKYNRARQARITTELIEIISGASALED